MKIFKILLVLGLVGSVVYATDKAQEVKQKTSEAVQAAGEYTKEQKEEIQKSFEEKLSKLSAEIKELKSDAQTATGNAKQSLEKDIKNLEAKQKSLKKDMVRLKESSGKAWTEMKAGMGAALDKLSDSYQKAKKEFSEKKSE